MRRSVQLLLLLFAGQLSVLPAKAQDYPSRTVKIVVPYPAGGGVDGMARAIADRLGKIWSQSLIVENKGGAATMIGGADVARAEPDGYTLLLTSDSSITSNPFLFKKMPYDPITGLAPVTQLIDLHQMVVVHPSMPVASLQELVAYARNNPGKLNYGSYGSGSQPNLLFETIKKKTGIQIQQVPFRGIAPAITATLANDVQMTLGGASVTAEFIRTGRLKALAIGRHERLPAFPDVPTLTESGYADADPRSWFGLFAPSGTPASILKKVQSDVAALFREPDFKAKYVDSLGFTAVASTPEEFATFIKNDLEYKRQLITNAGIEPE